MHEHEIIHSGSHTTIIVKNYKLSGCQSNLVVTISKIDPQYETIMQLHHQNRPYIFNLKGIIGQDVQKLVNMFHTHKERSEELFGTLVQDYPEKDVLCMYFQGDQDMIYRIIVQVCIDILHCVGQISSKQGSWIAKYAMWHISNHKSTSNYRDAITHMACRFIVETYFYGPLVKWEEVYFDG